MGVTGRTAMLQLPIGKPGGRPTQFKGKGSRGHSGDAQLQENGRLQRPTMKRADLTPASGFSIYARELKNELLERLNQKG
jgi:hypothetical protein